jgi:hypothetical protein
MNKELENNAESKSGRPKGSLNKRNIEIFELAQELNCNPARILMLIALGDFEKLKVQSTEIDIDKRMNAAKDLMPYLYGKRKPVDSNGDDSESLVSLFLGQLNDKE